MYVWKKYAYTTPEFNFTQQSGNPYWIAISDIDDSGYHISDYPLSAFDGWIATNGSATFYFTYSDNKLYFGTAKGSTSRYVYDDTTQNGIRYWQPSENGLTVPQNATLKPEKGFVLENFFGYIVSDNASAYPDGEVQNGYYYEKVKVELKVVTGNFSGSYYVNEYTINHNGNMDITGVYISGSSGSYSKGLAMVGSEETGFTGFEMNENGNIYSPTITIINENTFKIEYGNSAGPGNGARQFIVYGIER